MPTKLIAGGKVVVKTAKGKSYQYFEKSGQRFRLHCAVDDPNLASEICKVLPAAAPIKTIADLARSFLSSSDFECYAESTKYKWRRHIERIGSELGTLSIRVFEGYESIELIEQWRRDYSASDRTRDYVKTVLSRVLSHAVRRGLIAKHHCAVLKKYYRGDRSDITWEQNELVDIMSNAPKHIRQVIALGYMTGLRRGDLLSLKWSDIKDDCIQIRTQKSRGRQLVEIPLYHDLRQFLGTIDRQSEYVLVSSRGRPWTGNGFHSSSSRVKTKQKITDKTFHDLRGTAATMLLRGGMRRESIILLMGWSPHHFDKVLARYISRENQFAVLKAEMQAAMGGSILPHLKTAKV